MHLGYDVYPLLVQVGRPTKITIRPKYDHCRFIPEVEHKVTVIPTQWWEPVSLPAAASGGGQSQTVGDDGALHIDVCCEKEQEYVILVDTISAKGKPVRLEFRFYALEADLFCLRPYKGDFHLHSYYSDGRECPGYVAASCRRIGMDFMAITDHRRYEPSLEAIKDFSGVDIDLRLYPGEEVHPPDVKVHIVNFGGSFSVNALFTSPSYNAAIDELAAQLSHIPVAYRRQYAACVWCFEQIRRGGGLGIFCHPYWFVHNRYDVSEELTSLLLAHQPYDALELIGGFHRWEAESNSLQVARYHTEQANGKKIPLVGASDSHGCDTADLFGWYYTVIFAPSPELNDIVAAVKDFRSVAVEAMSGETPLVHGSFRLVKYTYFLLREVFPLHDVICAAEGDQMLAYLTGDDQAAEALQKSKGRVATLYNQLWAEN